MVGYLALWRKKRAGILRFCGYHTSSLSSATRLNAPTTFPGCRFTGEQLFSEDSGFFHQLRDSQAVTELSRGRQTQTKLRANAYSRTYLMCNPPCQGPTIHMTPTVTELYRLKHFIEKINFNPACLSSEPAVFSISLQQHLNWNLNSSRSPKRIISLAGFCQKQNKFPFSGFAVHLWGGGRRGSQYLAIAGPCRRVVGWEPAAVMDFRLGSSCSTFLHTQTTHTHQLVIGGAQASRMRFWLQIQWGRLSQDAARKKAIVLELYSFSMWRKSFP